MKGTRVTRLLTIFGQVLVASAIATGATATRPALPAEAAPPSAVSEFQPSVQYGGRTVSIDINPTNPSAAISATESGGLFLTSDAGANWQHVGSLPVHRMSEVRYSPDNASVILATAWADGHVTNQGGIWRSADGGATWSRPISGDPQNKVPFCSFRPNTWGIAFAKGTNDVFVGHDCGVAVSHDRGATWTHVQPDPSLGTNAGARGVYGLTARASAGGTIVDICANDGHHRSADGGATWTLHNTAADALPGCGPVATHAITTSPYENGVLFAIVGPSNLYESDSSGAHWTKNTTPANGFNRPWWVKANKSGDNMANHFDVYFGSGQNTYKQTCTGTGPALRCGNSWTFVSVDHSASDSMEVAFSTAAGNNCAVFLAGDGGVHKTTNCGAGFGITGTFGHGYNALQLFEVTGETHPGHPSDYYFGTMDNNLWASGDSGATWPGVVAFEGFFIQVPHSSPASAGQKVTFVACAGCNQFLSGPVFTGVGGWPQPPSASGNPVVIDQGVYVEWTNPSPPSSQLSLTTNTGGSWTAVSGAVVDLSLSGLLKVAGPAANPTVYQAVNRPGNRTGLLKITGVRSGTATVSNADTGLVSLDVYCNGQGTWVCPTVFGVDPSNPNHLIAPDAGSHQMKISTDGGASWQVDSALTALVTNGGQVMFNGSQFGTVHAIAFDPNDGNRILVGTEAGGIIASIDGGATWTTMLGSQQIPAITSFFFDEVQNAILVSSYGRGLWKLDMTRRSATMAWSGDVTADYHDDTTLAATLTDTGSGMPIPFAKLHLAVGSQSCGAVTGANGRGACVVNLNQIPGSYTATATFAGNAQFNSASASSPYVIRKEETTTRYTGPTTFTHGGVAHLTGVLKEDGVLPIAGRTLTFTLGSGPTAQSCSGITATTGTAQCDIAKVKQPLGAGTVKAEFAGDPYYLPSSDGVVTPIPTTILGAGYTVGDDGVILATTNSGGTWVRQISHTNNDLHAVAVADPMTAWAFGEDGTIVATVDGGAHWTRQLSHDDSELNGAFFFDSAKGYVVGDEGTILTTANGGGTWSRQHSGTKRSLSGIGFFDNLHGVIVGEHGIVLTTANGGATWTMRRSKGVELKSVAVVDTVTAVAVGEDGTILRTTNRGLTWQRRPSGTERELTSVSISDNPLYGLAVGDEGVILATSDGGLTWQKLVSGTRRDLEGTWRVDPTHGWVVGEEGVIRATSNGVTWVAQTSGNQNDLEAIAFA
jgi:photosystem II stability/assembly factor-like uncharacterized protein